MPKLSVCLAATKSYLHVWKHVVRRIVAAARHRDDVHISYASDDSPECKSAFDLLYKECPATWVKEHRPLVLPEAQGEKYKVDSQLVIARLHNEGFAAARAVGADQCWRVEADILVPPDSLRMMEWALSMPQADGSPYYDVAFCTYNNGLFIGGRGSITHPIAEDFRPEERKLTKEIIERYEAHKKDVTAFQKAKKVPEEAWHKKTQTLFEDIKNCPPNGNVWELNGKHGWRPRGWLDSAYPAIGRGALVPSDWAGEGCNLLSKRALAVASFEGYEGHGTQDLFLCWHKYYPDNIRIACITHTVCDHVKKQADGKLVHLHAFHEPAGEQAGHLRVIRKEWVEV